MGDMEGPYPILLLGFFVFMKHGLDVARSECVTSFHDGIPGTRRSAKEDRVGEASELGSPHSAGARVRTGTEGGGAME